MWDHIVILKYCSMEERGLQRNTSWKDRVLDTKQYLWSEYEHNVVSMIMERVSIRHGLQHYRLSDMSNNFRYEYNGQEYQNTQML